MGKIYAGIDPGLSTGVAIWEEDTGEFGGFQTVPFNKMETYLLEEWDTLWERKPSHLVIEDYRLNPHTAKKVEKVHSQLETVQVIGMFKIWAKANDIPITVQARQKKEIGFKYWDKKKTPKSNPMNHAYDAGAHLMYWLVQHKITKVKL